MTNTTQRWIAVLADGTRHTVTIEPSSPSRGSYWQYRVDDGDPQRGYDSHGEYVYCADEALASYLADVADEIRELLPFGEPTRSDLIAAVKMLRSQIHDMLLSADCTWEARRKGHDWAEACESARAILEATAKLVE